MIPADVFREVGAWDPRFRISADYELYLRIAARWPFTFSREKLVRYRLNPAGLGAPNPSAPSGGWRRTCDLPLPRRRRSAAGCPPHQRAGSRDREQRLPPGHARSPSARQPSPDTLCVPESSSHVVLPYLAALWCPAWLLGALRRLNKRDRDGTAAVNLTGLAHRRKTDLVAAVILAR